MAYDIEASPKLSELIISAPISLQHEGRLRGSRRKGEHYRTARQRMKPCGHFAMYAYNVYVPGEDGWCLGIRFASGYRCYYPATREEDENNSYVRAIVNAESGSYWTHDNLVGKALGAGYVEF